MYDHPLLLEAFVADRQRAVLDGIRRTRPLKAAWWSRRPARAASTAHEFHANQKEAPR
jgi:hypothetical protein